MNHASLVYKHHRQQAKQTTVLIQTFGQEISLIRPAGLMDDGAGGKTRVSNSPEITLAGVQRFLGGLQTEGRGVTTEPLNWFTTSLGDKFKEFFVLIGEKDDDIRPDDYFVIERKKYVVLFLHDTVSAYMTKATCGMER